MWIRGLGHQDFGLGLAFGTKSAQWYYLDPKSLLTSLHSTHLEVVGSRLYYRNGWRHRLCVWRTYWPQHHNMC